MAQAPTVSSMIRIQLLCGMRPQDVCGMTTGAIDRSSDIWMYRPAEHKTAYRGQELVKAIPPAAQEILKPFLRDDPAEPLFSPADSLAHWRSLERKATGKRHVYKAVRRPYSTASYGKAIVYGIGRADRLKIKIPHWSPNQLRHSIATQLRESSGIEAAQLFLGHSKPNTTLIYAEQSAAKLAEIARQLVSPFDEPSAKPSPPKP